ncbi:GNAT family N-acetyltransferase [Mesorhizobium retamae]|uniref:GNAT family N-acetyltransferase n=1 Tax=Mesorhizobium retamae TaxID=2912854 RepID=A0ABS9QD24_9HYPH|nr:GNAT family N-acetyltransferase [Mesorhizobium sp. IRAMC:0171]MCG7505305.1 GNAT family N-acetyltransferase [Mesorhizobium sp. IRAMC:0171]
MISIRPAEKTDLIKLAALFEQMQQHYGVPCPAKDVILADLASLPAGVEILVAETDRLIGFATFSTIYPGPGLKSGFFLKDLFVAEAVRGRGVGQALLRRLARLAVARGLSRVDWTADRNNVRLLAFYDETGAMREEEKVFFRLTGQALQDFAGED